MASHGWVCASGFALIHAFAAGTNSPTVGSDFVDQSDLLGLRRLEPRALRQHVHERVLDAEHPDSAGNATTARQQAKCDLGEADNKTLDVRGNAVVTREGDLQAPAQCGAVDGGHDGLAEGLERPQIPLDRLDGVNASPAFSGPILTMPFRSPPAKKVFFPLVMTTPVTESFSATRRSTALCMDSE